MWDLCAWLCRMLKCWLIPSIIVKMSGGTIWGGDESGILFKGGISVMQIWQGNFICFHVVWCLDPFYLSIMCIYVAWHGCTTQATVPSAIETIT